MPRRSIPFPPDHADHTISRGPGLRASSLFSSKARSPMSSPEILAAAVLNGLMTGAVYALIAVGLTLIYGVLHIINFAHGACLMLALYAVYFLKERSGIDPYMALPIAIAGMFALGYALQRIVINKAGHGKDENILLATLGI